MSEQFNGIHGRGWAFPPSFNLANGVAMVIDQDDIEQSLKILFTTQPGERIMRREYGCDLASLMFETVDDDLLANITTQVTESILRYEQRVALDAVEVNPVMRQPGKVAVTIVYRIRGEQGVRRMQAEMALADGRTGLFAP